MPNIVPFPYGLINNTPATIREAFDKHTNSIVIDTGALGDINITSTISKIIQDVGRFAERFNSDCIYGIQDIMYLCQNKYPMEQPIDEIFTFGIRADGVDHNGYIMSQINNGLTNYCRTTPYYRRILAVRVSVNKTRDHYQEVIVDLKDITHEFLLPNAADYDKNGRLIFGPYPEGNPIPKPRI